MNTASIATFMYGCLRFSTEAMHVSKAKRLFSAFFMPPVSHNINCSYCGSFHAPSAGVLMCHIEERATAGGVCQNMITLLSHTRLHAIFLATEFLNTLERIRAPATPYDILDPNALPSSTGQMPNHRDDWATRENKHEKEIWSSLKSTQTLRDAFDRKKCWLVKNEMNHDSK
jgi:hypothetical protein